MFLFFLIWPNYVACRILVPQPGMDPVPPALKVQSLNHGPPGKPPTVKFQGAEYQPSFLEVIFEHSWQKKNKPGADMVFPCLHVTESRRWKLRSALIEGKGQEREHASREGTVCVLRRWAVLSCSVVSDSLPPRGL